MRTCILALALLALAAPGSAQQADAPSPTEYPRRHAVAHEQVVALLNPMGAENRLDLGLRSELGDDDDLFTQGTHLEAGVSTALSPVYAYGGGYLEVSPLSFLVVRADVQGAGVWPIGMSGTGYYGVASYGADIHSQSLLAEDAGTASGWSASVGATLQGAIDFGAGSRLLFASELTVMHTSVGTAAYQYSMRHDAILAREDTLLLSSSFVGLEITPASDLVLRFGAYDDMRNVPASGYVGNQVGPLAMIEWHHVSREVASLGIFVRGGGYTHHAIRQGEATILAGLSIDFEMGEL